jgi:RNase P/RNase MRP subunit p29
MLKHIAVGFTAAAMAAAPAFSQEMQEETAAERTGADWVSLTGAVEATDDKGFSLSMGERTVRIRMADYGAYNAHAFRKGDDVTVTGQLDQQFYERQLINPSSVYVDRLGTYFYANAPGEKGGYTAYPTANFAPDDDWLGVSGKVVSVEEGSVVVDAGVNRLKVLTDQVDNAPRLQAGDRVAVYGKVQHSDLFEKRKVQATSLTLLSGG